MQKTQENVQRSAGTGLGESVASHTFLQVCFSFYHREVVFLFLRKGENVYSTAGICLTTFL